MKKILFIAVLFINCVQAQDIINTQSFLKEFEMIRQREMSGHDRLGAVGVAGEYTVATDNFDVHHIRFDWNVNPAIHFISGKISFDFTITQSTNSITFDLLNQLTVDSVWYHGNKITFIQNAQHGVVLTLPAIINSGVKDSVSIFYQGVPAASGFGTFYQGAHAGVPVIWTLSEPYGAREWWPCKNGLTDKADSIDVFITCDQQYQPSSNGLIISNTVNGSNRTTHFKHRFPIATYLVAIAVTNYQINNDTVMVGNSVIPIQNFNYPETPGFNGFISYHRSAFRTFSNLFGPYPFAAEKYGHTQWAWGGGMEHQTNSFVNFPSPNLAAHELGHQWFGDFVTCKSWQHIWLNEGFATYATLAFLEYGYPNSYGPLFGQTFNSVISDSTGSVFCYDTSDVSRIFSSRLSYNKGAMVLHMLRAVLGDSTFFRGVRRYINDPAVKLGFAVTADLQRNMELESGKNLSTFFQKWVYGEGYANYKAEWSQNKNNWVKVKLNQSTTHPSVSFYDMPVTLLLRGATQGVSYVVDHKFSGQEFWLDAGFVVDTVIIDPNYSILAKIRTSIKQSASTNSDEIKIYPNPTPGQLYVSIANPSDKKLFLRLYNSIGQLVYTRNIETPGRDELITIPSTVMARGTYILQLSNEKGLKMAKKIIH